ncbi:hypothetical protein ABT189_30775 [Streptomyces sp900105755]|uniref:hypothetical protein n=1 Tax=Streptomyces sp. 900105755 TaxID=3154389 RepID=UPI003330DAEF
MRHPADATPVRKPPRTAPRPVPAPVLGAWERSRRLGLREVRGPTAATAVAVHAEPPRRALRDLESERAEQLCTGHKTPVRHETSLT